MFDHLDWPATWAGNLRRSVFRVELLGVFPNEGMACYDAVKSCVCDVRELNFLGSSCGVALSVGAVVASLVGGGGGWKVGWGPPSGGARRAVLYESPKCGAW